jgi:hypothetical protein
MDDKHIIGLDPADGHAETLASRKARLKRQADIYRVGIVHARAHVRHGARPEALFHQAFDHAAWAVRSRVDKLLRPAGINVATIMPYAVTAFGFLTRRRLLKPALGVLAAAAAVAYYVQHRRNNTAGYGGA